MANTEVVYKIIFSDIALARIFIRLPRFEVSMYCLIVLNGNLNLIKSNYFCIKFLILQVQYKGRMNFDIQSLAFAGSAGDSLLHKSSGKFI